MEASAAAGGPAQGDAGAAEAQQGPDLSSINDGLSQLQQSQQEMREFLSSHPALAAQQEVAAPGPEAPTYDLSEIFDPAADYDSGHMADQLLGAFDQRAQEANRPLMEKLAAHEQRLADAERQREYDMLAYEIPALQEKETVDKLSKFTSELAESFPQVRELSDQPWFLKLAYYAAHGVDMNNEERSGAESPGVARLEGGSGASPAGSSQVDHAARIKAAAQRSNSVLPF